MSDHSDFEIEVIDVSEYVSPTNMPLSDEDRRYLESKYMKGGAGSRPRFGRKRGPYKKKDKSLDAVTSATPAVESSGPEVVGRADLIKRFQNDRKDHTPDINKPAQKDGTFKPQTDSSDEEDFVTLYCVIIPDGPDETQPAEEA